MRKPRLWVLPLAAEGEGEAADKEAPAALPSLAACGRRRQARRAGGAAGRARGSGRGRCGSDGQFIDEERDYADFT